MIKTAISFFQKFSNREIAITIWIIVVFIWALSQRKISKDLFHVIKAFFVWKLTISYILMFSYITFMLLSLYALGIWRLTHFLNTMLWILCVAFVMLFKYSTTNDEYFFKNAIKDNLKILIVLEFIINLYVFNLWIELFFVPFIVILGGMIAIAETDAKYDRVRTLLNHIMAIIVLYLISYALYMMIFNFKHFATFENFENFYTPILLTIMFLPFIYLTALYVSYESLFVRLRCFTKESSLLYYVKKKTLLTFGLNLRGLNKWSKHVITLRFIDENEVDESIQAFKSSIHHKKINT